MHNRYRIRQIGSAVRTIAGVAAFSACADFRDRAPLDWTLPPVAVHCSPTTEADSGLSIPAMRAGRYELTLVATRGSNPGQSTRGRLWLTHTSASDRSPRTGQPVPKSDTLESPLYGASDLAFDEVGAPMMRDTIAPSPLSTDPVYPGVRVVIQNWQDTQPKRPVVLIGTLSNLRDGQVWLDGGGIGLFVDATAGSDFFGRWGPWGLMANGSGYFCARAVP